MKKLNHRHTLKATLAVESIRNKTQSDISRCCAARLQFIKKRHQPLVLGAATFNGNGSILIKFDGLNRLVSASALIAKHRFNYLYWSHYRDKSPWRLMSSSLTVPGAVSLQCLNGKPPSFRQASSFRHITAFCASSSQGSGIGSIRVLQGGRPYSTKSFVKKVISTLNCCLRPAADVTADQTGELSALQAMTRQVEVDITSGLAEEMTQITVYHTEEASTSRTLPVTRPKLSLFHSLMRQQITGPCEQQKESFIIAELAKRFIPAGPRFSLCEEYMQVIGLREKCEKGLLPTEEEFKFLSLWPSVTWYGWLYRETQKQKAGIEYEEIRFCLNEIRRLSQESLYSFVFLHPLLDCLVKESSKRAFSFEPTFERACEVLHTREILSPTQERHHALKFRDLLGELAYWEKRVMAAALHIPAVILKSSIGLEPEPRRVPLGKVEVFLHRLMLEARETSQIPLSGAQERLLIPSVFEPMTLEGILVVIGGFLTFAVAIFFLFRWLFIFRWPIRGPVIPHEVPITKRARSNFVGIEDSNLEKMKELREPRIVWPEPRKPGNELTGNVRGGLGIPRPPPPRLR